MNVIPALNATRRKIRETNLADEAATVEKLVEFAGLSAKDRASITASGADLVRKVRGAGRPQLMEAFLAEYGLSTREGVALMCLAEAMLRVPDAETVDELIEDKIAPSEWGRHLGASSSSLVNASTWALMLTGSVLREEDKGLASSLRAAVRRLGEPVIRQAVAQAMRELGRNFVLGRDIGEALRRAERLEARGYTYSYDMLGEAARTMGDAEKYFRAYENAIKALTAAAKSDEIRDNPGISVKLSALHPRYEFGQRDRVMTELVDRARALALAARDANLGFNIDAEEADRLDLSLDVIEAVLSDPRLAGWDGFGVVVQAYGRRAAYVLDWLYELASRLDRKIMVRLVKGAYWDTEIKRAQTLGLASYPLFTRKASTDVSYIACARKLLGLSDRIYAQFATHNAHTVAAVLHMADGARDFEFQRLHGMGETLHEIVREAHGTRCRIYAPVGAHRDLLAYLVRRLLENGANSSFVHQIVDASIPPAKIARDPFAEVEFYGAQIENPGIPAPVDLFGQARANAKGWDITDPVTISEIEEARAPFRTSKWEAGPLLGTEPRGNEVTTLLNPADPSDVVGEVRLASEADVDAAFVAAGEAFAEWSERPVSERAAILCRVADLFEANAAEFFALCAREAGKVLADGVAELREAVDFLRYYAAEAERLGEAARGRGVFACISPWNFPLAIFTGQLTAALAAGNVVIAKPAEQTPLTAHRAVQLFHEAGVPRGVLQLLTGGGDIGAAISRDPRVAGLCFTGSTETAQRINRAMAASAPVDAPLIAETGGLNAMIVDSSALPEQAVRDIVGSAFQSAGQRCSALRCLYVQEDVAPRLTEMLFGAMDELRLGDPWALATDVGPVIDDEALAKIAGYVDAMAAKDKVLKRLDVPAQGRFVGPAVIKVSGIGEIEEEIFGPVLHVATFKASEIDRIVADINAKGYGLTFGLHTRIDNRVQQIVEQIRVGNIYVNRNQIGAVVGSQPFGGEGLSGTGPKAGGPHYLKRFIAKQTPGFPPASPDGAAASQKAIQKALGEVAWRVPLDQAIETLDLPGPTGESNRLASFPRGAVLCLGPAEALPAQVSAALAKHNGVVAVAPDASAALAEAQLQAPAVVAIDGRLDSGSLTGLQGIAAVMADGPEDELRAIRQALANREGPIVPLIAGGSGTECLVFERHTCIDTTAAGGNASLLASA